MEKLIQIIKSLQVAGYSTPSVVGHVIYPTAIYMLGLSWDSANESQFRVQDIPSMYQDGFISVARAIAEDSSYSVEEETLVGKLTPEGVLLRIHKCDDTIEETLVSYEDPEFFHRFREDHSYC